MQGYLKISICVFLLTFVVSIRGDSNSTQGTIDEYIFKFCNCIRLLGFVEELFLFHSSFSLCSDSGETERTLKSRSPFV